MMGAFFLWPLLKTIHSSIIVRLLINRGDENENGSSFYTTDS